MKELKCTQLDRVPPVVSESQQTVLCPKCKHYSSGFCVNPMRTSDKDVCPFDGKPLPLEEVKDEEERKVL